MSAVDDIAAYLAHLKTGGEHIDQIIFDELGNDGAGRTDDGVAERGTCSSESRRPMAEYVYGTDGREGHWLTDEEIVRCRDCKHFRSLGDDYLFCNLASRELDGGDGFCAWGERRADHD